MHFGVPLAVGGAKQFLPSICIQNSHKQKSTVHLFHVLFTDDKLFVNFN